MSWQAPDRLSSHPLASLPSLSLLQHSELTELGKKRKAESKAEGDPGAADRHAAPPARQVSYHPMPAAGQQQLQLQARLVSLSLRRLCLPGPSLQEDAGDGARGHAGGAAPQAGAGPDAVRRCCLLPATCCLLPAALLPWPSYRLCVYGGAVRACPVQAFRPPPLRREGAIPYLQAVSALRSGKGLLVRYTTRRPAAKDTQEALNRPCWGADLPPPLLPAVQGAWGEERAGIGELRRPALSGLTLLFLLLPAL